MITYNLRKPDIDYGDDNAGVVGENLSFEEEFVIKGLAEQGMSFVFHLRFSDGLVNSVVPESVSIIDGNTHLVWLIRKNDIFSHGYFEFQIEGRKDDIVFQTEIIRLCAKESIPIEDREYENPNSETLALRDEMYTLHQKAEACKDFIVDKFSQIGDGVKLTLSDFNITDAYTKTEVNSRFGLPLSVTFDENWIPLKTADTATIYPGILYGFDGYKNTRYVFLSSKATKIFPAAFSEFDKLTDIYIDNTRDNVSIQGTMPEGVTLHYVDDFNVNESFVKALIALGGLKADTIYSKEDNYIKQTLSDNVSGSFLSEYSGSQQENASFEHTAKISCKSGDEYKVTASYGYHAPLAVFYNADESFNSYYLLSSSELVTADGEIVKIPEGAAYVAFNNYTPNGALSVSKNSPVIVTLAEKTAENSEKISENSEDISELKSTITSKADSLYSNDSCFETVEATLVQGKYARYDNGTYTDSSSFEYSEPIECSTGDVFRVSSIYGYSAPLAVFYDSGGNFLGYFNRIDGAWKENAVAEIVTVPENAASVVFNNLSTKAELIIEKGVPISLKEQIENNAADIAALGKSLLYGKTIYCDGDSVAYGDGSGGYSYCDFIAENNGMTMTKRAVGGTTFAVREGRTDSIYERIAALCSANTSYNYILLEGGFNDMFNSIDIGSVSETDYSGGYDTSTAAGAFEQICYLLKTTFPDTKILFVLGHRILRGSCDTKQLPYWEIYRRVCEKWSIPYVDLAKESGLIGWKDDEKGYEINDKYFKTSSSTGHGDGVHPLKEAYEKFYVPLVEEKLKTLEN